MGALLTLLQAYKDISTAHTYMHNSTMQASDLEPMAHTYYTLVIVQT